MRPQQKPRVLCVDDEPLILEGLSLQLRKKYEVVTANGGGEALQLLEKVTDFVVIVSDMRMPGMDGATFLSRAKGIAPDATRMLLTGQADIESAIAAINDGQVFRFLTKPCRPEVLQQALTSAVEQNRLVTSERVLLRETLNGSIRALSEVLSLVSPTSFGRASRIKRRACELANALNIPNVWEIEIAAMLSQLACVALSPKLSEKLYRGQPLLDEERDQVDRLPQVSAELLANIPRLEPILEILSNLNRNFGSPRAGTDAVALPPIGARILKLVIDNDALEAQGVPPALAMETLRGRGGRYDTAFLEGLAKLLGAERTTKVHEIPLRSVRPGMIFLEDVQGPDGLLLIARGYEVTAGLVERLNYASSDVQSRLVKVSLKGSPDAQHANPA